MTPPRDLSNIDPEVLDLLRRALGARKALGEGRYCECAEPDLRGDALMCFRCDLRNRDQEVAAVHRIVDAHDFVPGKLGGLMCAVCTNKADIPRHHGVGEVGRTSWGTEVQGRSS